MKPGWAVRLKAKMFKYKITNKELAKRFGVTNTYIGYILNGVRPAYDWKAKLEAAVDEIAAEREKTE